MAIIAYLTELDPVETLEPGLTDPYHISDRFPTPSVAIAYLTGGEAFEETPIVMEGLSFPHYIASALVPAGDFLEPTIGQIWPRIG